MRNVLVVGGSGFIGRHLCDYLSRLDYAVVATSRRADAAEINLPGVQLRQLDVLASDWFDFSGFDCLVYLAARAHVLDESAADPLAEFRRVNCEAALAVARRAAEQGVKRFIYLSSIGVNGLSSRRPFRETDPPRPLEPYAQSKLEAEQALDEFCPANGMELVILRPVLVYGRGAPGNFARLVAAVSAGRWLPVGGIDNRRSLLAVQNLAQLIELCIRHPQAAGELFLAADGDDVSTAELVRQIGIAIDRPARLLNLPMWLLRPLAGMLGKSREIERVGGSLQADSGKARELLGWRPLLSLREALGQLASKD
jgi:nucleoside-diphosphate-sugar epimerase